MDVEALAGSDALAPLRVKAWRALCEWVKWRCARQRGAYIPNLLQVFWTVTSAEGGSRLRKPVFFLSPRFTENYGVHPTHPPLAAVPPPAPGDDINFYHLAIQFSDGLTKDQAFICTRDMLFRLGEAASQGRELTLSLGVGTLHICERLATFEWTAGFGGHAPAEGAPARTSSLDPLSGRPREGGDALSALHLVGAARSALLGSECSGSHATSRRKGGSRLGGGSLSAEEEAQLFRELDSLDPEVRAEAAAAVAMRASELEQPTREEVARLLKLSAGEMDGRTVNELGDALAAKAAQLEAQLLHSKSQNAKLESELRLQKPKPPSSREARSTTKAPPSAPTAPLSQLSVAGSGSLAGNGSRASCPAAGRSKPAAAALGGAERGASAPLLSVGFGSGGPAMVSAPPNPPAKPKAPPMKLTRKALENQRPKVSVHLSGPPTEMTATTARVPVAPPIKMSHAEQPQANDAAAVAWRLHAAPVPPVRRSGAAAKYGRSVGGPAPPFLPVPPIVAAQMKAASLK
ncbi:hypothetical protein AB1Y20_000916 [Prymnesium parvum]|uniref:Uncharacterized protein n=1 Tax=Prymnesium parvum TaxID=97485 RepID=A0AB34KC14_PRYPA